MEKSGILKQMQSLLLEEEVNENPEELKIVVRKKQEQIKKLETIRLLNLKLMLGLWLCKFIKNLNKHKLYSIQTQSPKPKEQKTDTKASIIQAFQYVFAFFLLLTLTIGICLKLIADSNSLT